MFFGSSKVPVKLLLTVFSVTENCNWNRSVWWSFIWNQISTIDFFSGSVGSVSRIRIMWNQECTFPSDVKVQ